MVLVVEGRPYLRSFKGLRPEGFEEGRGTTGLAVSASAVKEAFRGLRGRCYRMQRKIPHNLGVYTHTYIYIYTKFVYVCLFY